MICPEPRQTQSTARAKESCKCKQEVMQPRKGAGPITWIATFTEHSLDRVGDSVVAIKGLGMATLESYQSATAGPGAHRAEVPGYAPTIRACLSNKHLISATMCQVLSRRLGIATSMVLT